MRHEFWRHYAPTRRDVTCSVALKIERQYQLTPCSAMLAEESRGLIGFHNFTACPACQHELCGFVATSTGSHGTQGIQTAVFPTLRDMLPVLKRMMRQTWQGKASSPRYGWAMIPTIHDVTFRR